MRRKMSTAVLAAYVLLYASAISVACKIVINDQRLPEGTFNPINIMHKSFTVDVKVREQVADVTVRPVFHNANPYIVEGTYFLSIPAGAQVRDFKMKVGDKEMAAELLDADKARQIYTSIVQKQRDPALLELVGTQMLKCSIFPIAASSDIEVSVTYTTLLSNDGGLVTLDVPFSNQFGGDYPVPQVTVKVDIDTVKGLKNVYSPTHDVEIRKKGDTAAIVSYEAKNYNVRKAFRVFWQVNSDDLGLSVMSFREGSEDGYFIALAQPKVQLEGNRVLPKDVVFVFDRSGSMAGEKMKQGKEALSYFINSLNDGDRFNIVDFASEAASLADGLLAATPAERAKALRYVEGLRAAGSTNIEEALAKGVSCIAPDPARVQMVLFATDGLPTVGEQRPDKLVEMTQSKAGKIRVFAFGVGMDVNTQLLDRLAETCRGARDYVAPEEKIEAKVSALFEKVSHPVLSELALDLGTARAKDVYPRQLPDLFKGNQLVVFGRYEGTGVTTLKLTGLAGGEKKEYRYEVNLAASDAKSDFIPRLWAARKIAFLVDSIRMNNTTASKEVVDEIVSLGKKFGIVTPYTSFLIVEEGADGMPAPASAPAPEQARQELRKLSEGAQASGGAGRAAESKAAQDASKKLKEDRERDDNESLDKDAGYALDFYRSRGRKAHAPKVVGTKTFSWNAGVWVDGTFDAEKMKDQAVKVTFMSDEYLKLAGESAELAKYFGVGDRLIVVHGGKVYEIVPAPAPVPEEKK